MSEPTRVVILAAGKGTRMKSELPKVMHLAADRPLLAHAVDAARELAPEQIVVVIGHGAAQVRATMGDGLSYALQEPQLGTGHALQVAMPVLDGADGDLLVTYGDMPLLSAATLARMRDTRRQSGAAAAVLTAIMDPPPAYGRIVRDPEGRFLRIVEDKDCTAEQRAITEVNIAVYGFAATPLAHALSRLRNDNAQGEYYLTDVLELLREDGHGVVTVTCDDAQEVMGVNDLPGLAEVDAILRARGGTGSA